MIFITGITAICLGSFIYALIKEPLLLKISTGLLFLGFALLWPVILADSQIENYIGFCMFCHLLGALGVLIFYLQKQRTTILNGILIILLVLGAIFPQICRIIHWPGSLFWALLSVIPLTFLVIQLGRSKIGRSNLMGFIVFGLLCAVNVAQLIYFLTTPS